MCAPLCALWHSPFETRPRGGIPIQSFVFFLSLQQYTHRFDKKFLCVMRNLRISKFSRVTSGACCYEGLLINPEFPDTRTCSAHKNSPPLGGL